MLLISILATTAPDCSEGLEDAILALAEGNTAAMVSLYEQTKTAVYGFALSLLKNREDAEDVLQETYLLLYRTAPRYRPAGNPLSWMLGITKNLCRNCIRAREKTQDIPEARWESLPFLEEGLSPTDRMVLADALARLSDEERQIVMLHALSGFRHREIADFLEMPLMTVISRYRRAIAKLQQFDREGASK